MNEWKKIGKGKSDKVKRGMINQLQVLWEERKKRKRAENFITILRGERSIKVYTLRRKKNKEKEQKTLLQF